MNIEFISAVVFAIELSRVFSIIPVSQSDEILSIIKYDNVKVSVDFYRF